LTHHLGLSLRDQDAYHLKRKMIDPDGLSERFFRIDSSTTATYDTISGVSV